MKENKKPERLNTRSKKRAMIKSMESTLGNVTASIRGVGINRSTHYKWMQDDPKYKVAIDEVIEIDLDFTEAALRKKIRAGDLKAIIFHLKTRGKHRENIETNDRSKEPRSPLEDMSDEELMHIINREVRNSL